MQSGQQAERSVVPTGTSNKVGERSATGTRIDDHPSSFAAHTPKLVSHGLAQLISPLVVSTVVITLRRHGAPATGRAYANLNVKTTVGWRGVIDGASIGADSATVGLQRASKEGRTRSALHSYWVFPWHIAVLAVSCGRVRVAGYILPADGRGCRGRAGPVQ